LPSARWYLSRCLQLNCRILDINPTLLQPIAQHTIMNLSNSPRTALAIAVAALVAACGGGEASRTSVQEFVARVSPDAPQSDRLRALGAGGGTASAAAVTITNAQLFQWAQLQYPELFGTATPTIISNLPYDGKVFDVRDFKNGSYLGVANGVAYGLGPFTGGQLVSFGAIQNYADAVCSRVNCGSTGGGGTGALNGCTMPASEALRVGNRFAGTFVNTVFAPVSSSGEYSFVSTIDGAATFDGQSALKGTTQTTGFQSGQTVNATILSYQRAAANDLVESLGSEVEANFAGVNLTLRAVFTPYLLNSEFTLQPGGTLNKTIGTTQTYINAPFPLPPTTGSSVSTITFEARETISVLGRSFETCRYKEIDSGSSTSSYSWYIVGKGIPARNEARDAAGAVLERTELKSGTLNGSPL
jgi:hypothetical protein